MKRGTWIYFAGFGLFFSLVAWRVWPPSQQPYFDMVANLRAAGEPVDFDGLAPRRFPDQDNGAFDLRAAFAWLDASMPPEIEWKEPGPWNPSVDADWEETATPAQMKQIGDLMQGLEPCLGLLHAAASKPRLQFLDEPRDACGFPAGDHIRTLQRLDRILGGEAVGAFEEGRRLDAIESIAKLGDRVDCVILIDHMVAAAIKRHAVRALRREVESGRLSSETARKRLDSLLRCEFAARMPAVLRAERAWLIQAFRAVSEGTWTIGRRTPWYERTWSRLFGASDDSPEKRLSAAVGESVDSLEKRLADSRWIVAHCEDVGRGLDLPMRRLDTYRGSLMTSLKTPDSLLAYPTVLAHFTRVDAAQRLARVALAVAEHRRRTGAWPAALDDVASTFPDGIPIDPYVERPFSYERTETGVRIASTGRFADETPPDEETLRERCHVWMLH